MFRVPAKNEDLRHLESALQPTERLAAINENKRLQAIRALGNRWLLAPDYNGHYRPELCPKVAA